jgi:hypothetical protein
MNEEIGERGMHTCVGCHRRRPSPVVPYLCTECNAAIGKSMPESTPERFDDGALTDLARNLFAAWGVGSGRPPRASRRDGYERSTIGSSVVPGGETQRLRKFADALGANGLLRIAAEDAAMRRLEAMLLRIPDSRTRATDVRCHRWRESHQAVVATKGEKQ